MPVLNVASDWGPLMGALLGFAAVAWQGAALWRQQSSLMLRAVFATEKPVAELWLTDALPRGLQLWARFSDGSTKVLAGPAQVDDALAQLEMAGFSRPIHRR